MCLQTVTSAKVRSSLIVTFDKVTYFIASTSFYSKQFGFTASWQPNAFVNTVNILSTVYKASKSIMNDAFSWQRLGILVLIEYDNLVITITLGVIQSNSLPPLEKS